MRDICIGVALDVLNVASGVSCTRVEAQDIFLTCAFEPIAGSAVIGNGGQTMKIVVIGGTGLIGSKTTAILRQGGHEVVAASPNSGVNTITGEGLKEAVAGAQVVIDLANYLNEITL